MFTIEHEGKLWIALPVELLLYPQHGEFLRHLEPRVGLLLRQEAAMRLMDYEWGRRRGQWETLEADPDDEDQSPVRYWRQEHYASPSVLAHWESILWGKSVFGMDFEGRYRPKLLCHGWVPGEDDDYCGQVNCANCGYHEQDHARRVR